ncbi:MULTISPECIES: anthranilate synthase component II [Methylobacter]
MRVLIIDNYDSFTYNLYQYVGEILSAKLGFAGFDVSVKRNDEITINQVIDFNPDRIIISPGPGTPSDKHYFGICSDVILELGKSTPLLGVCLGMQGIAYCFGGKVVSAPVPMHGKISLVQHDERGLYRSMPQNFEVMRYHSLMVDAASLPNCLEITSVVADEITGQKQNLVDAALNGSVIMGVRHKKYPIEGIQYHPESFATEGGKKLLANFLL